MEGDEVDEEEDDLVSDPDRDAADDRDVEELEGVDLDIDVNQAQVQIHEVKVALLKVSIYLTSVWA